MPSLLILFSLTEWTCIPLLPRLYTSAISSCTKALCDVKGDACILMVREQDVSEAGQRGEDIEETSGGATRWLRVTREGDGLQKLAAEVLWRKILTFKHMAMTLLVEVTVHCMYSLNRQRTNMLWSPSGSSSSSHWHIPLAA